MKLESVKDIIEALGQYEEIKPLVQLGVQTVFEGGKDLKPLADAFVDTMVDMRTRAFERYLKNNFTREESLLLVLNDSKDRQEALDRMANSSKK